MILSHSNSFIVALYFSRFARATLKMPQSHATEQNPGKYSSPVSGAVVEDTASTSTQPQSNVQASQGEGTQTGIFAGAEKFMDSDANAGKKAKQDISNQGTAVLINNKLEFVNPNPNNSPDQNASIGRSDVENTQPHPHHHRHSQVAKPAFSINDLPPLPDFSENIDDADFLAWLKENNQTNVDAQTLKNIDPEVRKKYLRYLAELEARTRSRSNSLQAGEVRPRKDSAVSLSSSSTSDSLDSNGQSRRGPLEAVAHVLHLDRHARKKAKEAKKKEEAKLREDMDLEQWKEHLKAHHERKMARHAKAALSERQEKSDVTDSSDPSKNSTAVPMDLLNPEFMERKNAEEEILESGGDLASLSAKKPDDENFPSVSTERITQLIESDRQKQEAGKSLSPSENNLTADQLKVTFHTADSFDRLDRAANKTVTVVATK